MRRGRALFALALVVVGGALVATWAVRTMLTDGPVPSDRVELPTGGNPDGPGNGCYLMYSVHLLVADPVYGIAAVPRTGAGTGPSVIWPDGYTARRLAGGEVEVLNETGAVVATTGQEYVFLGPNPPSDPLYGGCLAGPPASPPPLLFDLAAVKARFEDECETPSVLEGKTCEQIDIDGMFGEAPRHLNVPTTLARTEWDRAKAVCKEIARFALDGEPLGYESIGIRARNGDLRADCRIHAG